MNITIIAAGQAKSGPLFQIWSDYSKRLRWKLTLHEIDARKSKNTEEKILEKYKEGVPLIVMDERGKELSSVDFSKRLQKIQLQGQNEVQFIIGAAEGLSDDIRKKADYVISFGKQTWPHMLVRVMLLEQIYRAQQILAGHPYHKE